MNIKEGQVLQAGQVFQLTKTYLTLRRGQYVKLPVEAICYLENGMFIEKGTPIFQLEYRTVTTEDIIQGISKIERIFEARSALGIGIPQLLKQIYKKYGWSEFWKPADRLTFYALTMISVQLNIINTVQTVYQSQGVFIADKHLEIIVSQMTCRALILNPGETGLFVDDNVYFQPIKQVVLKKNPKCFVYEPVVLGITKAALQARGFLSAASFQETVRVLSYAAVTQKKDFLLGLKENVILGYLLPAASNIDILPILLASLNWNEFDQLVDPIAAKQMADLSIQSPDYSFMEIDNGNEDSNQSMSLLNIK